MIRPAVRALVTAGLVFGGLFAVLQVGLARPGASDQIAARVVGVLDRTRGAGAEITIGSRRIVASCSMTRKHTMQITLDDGTRIVAAGPHVLRTSRVGNKRSLSLLRPPDLVAAELVLTGGHRLIARQITGRLQRTSVTVTSVDYRGSAAYEVTLRADHPDVRLIVDRTTLRPIAADYRSADLTATSRLFAARHGRKGC